MAENDVKGSGLPIKAMLKRGEVKILVVEDDKFLRELLVGKLAREGFTVLEATRGEEVEPIVKADKPHIILLDLVLPGADGFEVLSSLKAASESSAIPVIILSNLGAREDVEKALKLGAEEFMVKAHHTPQEIADTVKRTLEKHYVGQ